MHLTGGGFSEPMTATLDRTGSFVTPAPVKQVQSQASPTAHRIAGLVVTIIVIQAILFLAHWFVYHTWRLFRPEPDAPATTIVLAGVLVLSISFVVASLLAHRYPSSLVRLFYKVA